MSITEVLEILSSSYILSFVRDYLATKAMDKSWEAFASKYPVEYQLISALQESLEEFCKMMNWEYDSTAISDTFTYQIQELEGITSKSALFNVLSKATGMKINESQLSLWVSCFYLAISHPKREELYKTLISSNTFKATENISVIQQRVSNIENVLTKWHSKLAGTRRQDDIQNVFFSLSAYTKHPMETYTSHKEHLSLKYVYTRDDTSVIISPSMEYLYTLATGGVITQTPYIYQPFEWNYPGMDIKLINNSDKTLLVTEIVFRDIISLINPLPVLLLYKPPFSANARHIFVENHGWGDIKNLRIQLSASPINSDFDIDHTSDSFTHELFVGDVSDKINVDISDVLSDYGYISRAEDVKYPNNWSDEFWDERKRRKLYDFTKVYGTLLYSGTDYTGAVKDFATKFEAIVYLHERVTEGVPMPPSEFYDVKFEYDKRNYTICKSVSQVIKTDDCDRFVMTIGCEKSAHHDFVVDIITNLGTLTIPKVTLDEFVPRSGSQYTHYGKTQETHTWDMDLYTQRR